MKIIQIVLAISLLIFCCACSRNLIKSSGKQWDSQEVFKRMNDETIVFIDFQKKGDRKVMRTIKAEEIARIHAYFNDDKHVPSPFNKFKEKGVLSIITKKYAISYYRPLLSKISKQYLERTKNESPDKDTLVYVVDGEILKPNVEAKLFYLRFKKIKRIEVLSPEESQNMYGERAMNGAVIISSSRKPRTTSK